MLIRDAVTADLPVLHALNEAAVPNMNSMPPAFFERMLREAAVFRVPERAGAIAGMMLAMAPGTDYDSANFRWFSASYRDFLYVDRIVVAESARGQGIGRLLYDDLAAIARSRGTPRILCEVNLRPPNPGSLAFHARLGFREVHRLVHGPDKEVVMLERELSA